MPGGRPTKLTKALIGKAKQYDYKASGEALPTIEGLSLHLGVARSSVYLWTEVPNEYEVGEIAEDFEQRKELHQQFSDIVNGYLAEQSKLLITNGLRGKFNANITRLILSGKHGYVERQDIDHTTKGKELPTPILGGVSVKNMEGSDGA